MRIPRLLLRLRGGRFDKLRTGGTGPRRPCTWAKGVDYAITLI